jgi:hypothetical protein
MARETSLHSEGCVCFDFCNGLKKLHSEGLSYQFQGDHFLPSDGTFVWKSCRQKTKTWSFLNLTLWSYRWFPE